MRIGILALALVLGVATTAYAADEVLLNDGGAVEGVIQKVDQTGITVEVDGKSMLVEPADLDAHYFYEQWAKRIDKDAEAHLRLAVYAYENGLFNQARSQYRKAQRLDKELVKKFEDEVVPRIKEGVAEHLLGLTRAAMDKKDWHQAERLAAKILTQLEDTKAAAEAREALASVHLWQLNDDETKLLRKLARHLPRDEEKALQAQAKILKKMEPIQRRIDRARDQVTKGLRTKSANRQKNIFQNAAKSLEKAVEDLDKLAADAANDPALAEYVGELRTIAVREAIEAYVNAGNVYLIRRSYEQATNMANRSLALDPNSAVAKRFQQQVIRGSQMRSGWWGRGR